MQFVEDCFPSPPCIHCRRRDAGNEFFFAARDGSAGGVMQRNFRWFRRGRYLALAIIFLLMPGHAHAQGTAADYQRAQSLREKFQGLAVNVPGNPTWIEGDNHFWYRKSVPGGYEFIIVDADALTKKPAFDHEKLAAVLSAASGTKYTAVTLPFTEPVAAGGRGGGFAAGALNFIDYNSL